MVAPQGGGLQREARQQSEVHPRVARQAAGREETDALGATGERVEELSEGQRGKDQGCGWRADGP